MNDEKKSKIEALAARLHQARKKFEMLGMANSAGLNPEEAIRQTQDFELARAEYWEAEADLEAAQKP